MKKNLAYLLTLFLLTACGSKEKKSYEQYAASGLTTRTEALRQNLPRLADGGTLIGQEYATLSGIGWRGDSARSDIKTVCGDYPAVSAYRLDGLTATSHTNVDGFTAAQLRRDILETVRRGSLVICTWGVAPNVGTQHGASAAAQNAAPALATFLASLTDGYGKYAPVLFAVATPELYAAARESIERAKLPNVLLAYAAPTAEALSQAPADVAALILAAPVLAASAASGAPSVASDPCSTVLAPSLAIARERGVALGVMLAPTAPDNDYWTQTALPLATTPGLAFVVIAANAGEPAQVLYHAPYPGGPGAEGFMQLYNHPRTRFAHDLNGLYLTSDKH